MNTIMDFIYSIGSFFVERVNIDDLSKSFKLMGQGMLGIFVVMVIISLIVYLITKIPSKK